MATSPSTDLDLLERPGIRLGKLLRPIDRVRESGLLPLAVATRVFRPEFLGLCYHNVAEPIDPLTHFGYDCKRPAEFAHDLRLLRSWFGLADGAAFAHEPAPRPRRRGEALVTFDDGHREWHDVVLPLLPRDARPLMFVASATIGSRYLLPAHAASLAIAQLVMAEPEERERRRRLAVAATGLPADAPLARACEALRGWGSHEDRPRLLSLMAGWGFDAEDFLASRRPYLDEGQLRALAAAGCVIGAHGVDHRSLHDVPWQEVERQVLESCAALRDISGQAVVPFAFPYSRRVPAPALDRLRRRNPWIGAYFGTGGLRPAPPGFQERMVADWRFATGGPQRPDALSLLYRRAWLTHAAERLRHPARRGMWARDLEPLVDAGATAGGLR